MSAALAAGISDPPTSSLDKLMLGLEPYSGPMDEPAIKHLLRRSLTGIGYTDFQLYKGRSLNSILDSLLTKPKDPSPPIVNYTNGSNIIETFVRDGETWVNEPWDNNIEYQRLLSLKTWWIDNMLRDTTITEKMIMFWHNHIPVAMAGVFSGRMGYNYLNTIRKNALGNFRTLIKELTIDPMMLFYLNGNSNDKSAPDENYGRELQELFTIGKGPGSHYTEADVKAAARVLTGWKADYINPKVYWAAYAHDTNDKQFSAFYGNRIIRGRGGDEGKLELDELIDMILSNDECSKFICRKLYRFFVYNEISEFAEENIIVPLSKQFKDGGYEIKPIVKNLLSSAHFFDSQFRYAVIKSPVDYIIGLNKEFGTGFNAEIKTRFQSQMILYYFLITLAQDIGDPPNVAGWPAYYQFPQYDKIWVNTHTSHQRGVHNDVMVYYGYQNNVNVSHIDWIAYVNSYAHPDDPNALIEDIFTRLYDSVPDAVVKKYLKNILLSGQLSDYYWTQAWNDYYYASSDLMKRATLENRLKPFFQYILQMDEYQLT